MNDAVEGTINQISSSSVEWWSSFVCISCLDLSHYDFGCFQKSAKQGAERVIAVVNSEMGDLNVRYRAARFWTWGAETVIGVLNSEVGDLKVW